MDARAAIAPFADELVAIRHDLHAHPEIGLEERRTSALVAGLLAGWGWRVETGLGRTGVVGTLSRGTGRRRIGLRADMDALPIPEETGLPYASRTPGLMHACGHDGHTAMLLAAARALAASKDPGRHRAPRLSAGRGEPWRRPADDGGRAVPPLSL